MWIADKLTYRGKDTYIKAYKGNELVWEKTTPPTPVLDNYVTFTSSNDTVGFIYLRETDGPKVFPVLYYSYDTVNWTLWEKEASPNDYRTRMVFIDKGQTLYVRGKNPNGFSNGDYTYGFETYSSGGGFLINVGGNVMGLLDYENPPMEIPNTFCFSRLFKGCYIVNVSEDFLPATKLKNNAYYQMFANCKKLISVPKLPATTMEVGCYENMFSDCSSLVNAPELPATTMADHCYDNMFGGCTSLTTAPELPATTIADYCYQYMFGSCTSLVNAPALPATILKDYCYKRMFYNCTSLVNAPALPATTLANNCYREMFYSCKNLVTAPVLPAPVLTQECYTSLFENCTKLTEVTMLATDVSASNSLSSILNNAASKGTFYCASGMSTKLPTGSYRGVPTSWTIVEAS